MIKKVYQAIRQQLTEDNLSHSRFLTSIKSIKNIKSKGKQDQNQDKIKIRSR